MKQRSVLGLIVAAMVAVGGSALYAQSVTTGALSGKVVAAEDRAALPGAQVEAVHVPTGTRYNTVTRGDGRFDLPNARAGGPYTVTARMDGFQDQTAEDIHVRLGQTTDLDFNLQLASITEAITVTGESTAIINSGRTGAASNVSTEAIETLPTISRGLEDFARTNPFFSVIPDNDADSQVSVAGRNNRYNNISIDGAVNNDLFGLSDSGVPGGQTQTTPISLDAIQELQLLVAPYDVRQGGFSGGSINAITRSGSNQFTGSVFYYTRDEGLVGDGPDTFNEFGTFDDEQYGFRLGGPIVRDKVFFFVNGESDSLDEPSGFTIGGATGQDFGHQAEATRFRNALMSQYGFDPGGFNEVTLPTGSDKAFVRFDFNLAPEHQLTVRHNFVDADKGFLFPSNTTFTFPSHGHTIRNKTNSTVGQLNSIFGSNLFNEARVNIQKVEDRRGGSDGVPFPNVTVRLPDGTSLRAGTEQFSTANELDQDILAITDDVTWLRGDHTFTFGTHNELFSFRNLFIRDNFGTYIFNSLDDLERGVAFQLDHSFSLTDDPQQAAEFDSYQLALYASDQWQVRSNLTFTFGLRMDLPVFPDDPSRNPQSEQFFGLRTDETPSGDPIFSPRFGFNWDPENTGRSQLRGGIGIFAGRTPFVWLSNQYSNTGIEFGRLRATGQIPFNPDPFNQPRQVGSLFTNEIDLIDPDFKLPQIWRANVGYDRELGFWGLTGSVEVIHSQVIEDIDYQNLAVVPTGGTAFDGRPIFSKPFAQFTDVILLTNTSEGEQTSAAVKLERPFRRGLYGFASYVYTDATVINDGDSSQAISNWRFNETPGDPNNLPESTSDYEVEHRFNGALAYQFNIAKGWPTTVSLFYNAQSGRPYSTTFAFSNAVPTTINGDRETTDLIFVPNSADDVIIRGTRPDGTAATFADLDAYIELDEGLRSHRGGIVPRNASIAPWTHSMDLRLAQGFEVGRNNFEVTLDVLNLANLFDSDSGITRFVNFSGVAPIRYDGIDQATGKPIYTLLAPVFDPSRRFLIDDLRSRWRARLGVRWSF